VAAPRSSSSPQANATLSQTSPPTTDLRPSVKQTLGLARSKSSVG
jgi:hypothetical protein